MACNFFRPVGRINVRPVSDVLETVSASVITSLCNEYYEIARLGMTVEISRYKQFTSLYFLCI
jgi:hypothetical protein